MYLELHILRRTIMSAPSDSNITVHMTCSLDGYIADVSGGTSWMNHESSYPDGISLSQEYITQVLERIDCYIMGSKTYEKALELGWAYSDTPVIVMTSQIRSDHRPSVSFFDGELADLIHDISKQEYRSIWVVGGSSVVREFLLSGLVDEIVITFLPIIIGGGKPFFDNLKKEIRLDLSNVEVFDNGMVEITYQIIKTSHGMR